MDPIGIEPTPLVLQTSVRTSYTKGPMCPLTFAKVVGERTTLLYYSVGHCGIEPHLLTERFYRPLTSPDAETSQLPFPT